MIRYLLIPLIAIVAAPTALAQDGQPTVEERLARAEAILAEMQRANDRLQAEVAALHEEVERRSEPAPDDLLRDVDVLRALARNDAFREVLAEELIREDLREVAGDILANDPLQRSLEEHLVRSVPFQKAFGPALWKAKALKEQVLKDDRFAEELAEQLAEDRPRRVLTEELLRDGAFLRELAESSDFVGRLADNDRFVRALAENDTFIRCLKDELD